MLTHIISKTWLTMRDFVLSILMMLGNIIFWENYRPLDYKVDLDLMKDPFWRKMSIWKKTICYWTGARQHEIYLSNRQIDTSLIYTLQPEAELRIYV